MCMFLCVCSWSPGWWCPHWQTLLPAARQNLRWAPSPRTLPSSPTLPRLKSCQVTPNADTAITTFVHFPVHVSHTLPTRKCMIKALCRFIFCLFDAPAQLVAAKTHTYVPLRVPPWHLSLPSECGRLVLCDNNMCFDVKHNTCEREWIMNQKQRWVLSVTICT